MTHSISEIGCKKVEDAIGRIVVLFIYSVIKREKTTSVLFSMRHQQHLIFILAV